MVLGLRRSAPRTPRVQRRSGAPEQRGPLPPELRSPPCSPRPRSRRRLRLLRPGTAARPRTAYSVPVEVSPDEIRPCVVCCWGRGISWGRRAARVSAGYSQLEVRIRYLPSHPFRVGVWDPRFNLGTVKQVGFCMSGLGLAEIRKVT